jgi:hypothetical protein
VELRSGRHYQKQTYRGVPLTFRLGGHEVDSLRITWPNGLVQHEMALAVGRVNTIGEAPRLSGSCPMVFTWDGRGFRFITDVLGVAPLGASAGDGTYFPTDSDEYIQIPGDAVAEREGVFEVRITEELKEVAYIDAVTLTVLDRPAGVDVVVNDKFKGPPFPEFRLYGSPDRRPVRRAVDDHGADVTALIATRDGRAPVEIPRSPSGVAELHSLTLDLGAAPLDEAAVLILHGWVDWADGSALKALAQEELAGPIFPELQVRDAGGWTTAIEDMGLPAGKPKTIAVDLTGRFSTVERRIRIVTRLAIYWDEIYVIPSADAPPTRLTPLSPTLADLRFRGWSTPIIDPERRTPERFDYSRLMRLDRISWNPTPGHYTRFGDVLPLLTAADDHLVVMGSGDELRLEFPASGLPSLPPGWKRDFLLRVDGWAKDADPNTAFSQTVEPMPFRDMSAYPYPSHERPPDTPAHQEIRSRFQTRPALRVLPPIATAAGPAPSVAGQQAATSRRPTLPPPPPAP